jgi:hypothetical protein
MFKLIPTLSTHPVQSSCPNPAQRGAVGRVRSPSIKTLTLPTRVPCPKGVVGRVKLNKFSDLIMSSLSTLFHREGIPNGQGSILGMPSE